MIHHFCPQNPVDEQHGRHQMRTRLTINNPKIPRVLMRPQQRYQAPTIRPIHPCAQKAGRRLRTFLVFQVTRLGLSWGLLQHRFLTTVLYRTHPFTRTVPTFQAQSHQFLKRTFQDSILQQSIQTGMLNPINQRGNSRHLGLPVHTRLAVLPSIQTPGQKTLSRPILLNHVSKPRRQHPIVKTPSVIRCNIVPMCLERMLLMPQPLVFLGRHLHYETNILQVDLFIFLLPSV